MIDRQTDRHMIDSPFKAVNIPNILSPIFPATSL